MPEHQINENDALSLEYKLLYGYARREIDLSHFVNQTLGEGVVSILGDGLKEEFPDLFISEPRPLRDH